MPLQVSLPMVHMSCVHLETSWSCGILTRGSCLARISHRVVNFVRRRGWVCDRAVGLAAG